MNIFQSFKGAIASLFCVFALVFSTASYANNSDAVNSAEPLTVHASIEKTININTADAFTLSEVMSGVGEKKAAAIIAYRESNGNFSSVDELLMVKGIGEKTLEKSRAYLSVN